MSLLDELKSLDVDVDAGLKHFKGNAVLFEKLIRKFPASTQGLDVKSHFEGNDIKQAYETAHALKGICANLYLTPLYNIYAKISDSLKFGNTEGVAELIEQVIPIQEKIINTIAES